MSNLSGVMQRSHIIPKVRSIGFRPPMVRLSVIVPNYNSEKYIVDCIDSILSQTYDDMEIVISDDFSTDRSPTIIRDAEASHSNIRALLNNQNRGVAANRHKAILHSSGKYITTLDSDDFFYDRQKIEREMALIESFENQGREVLSFSRTVHVDEKGELLTCRGGPHSIKEGNILKYIIGRSCQIPRDFIMKRTQYEAVGGYDSSIPIYEDWDLKIRLASKYAFHYTGGTGTAYRRNSAGLSRGKVSENIKWLENVFWKNFLLVEFSERPEALVRLHLFMLKRLTYLVVTWMVP
jgi:glycosyltransferase involved in cell wall biosynthesis